MLSFAYYFIGQVAERKFLKKEEDSLAVVREFKAYEFYRSCERYWISLSKAKSQRLNQSFSKECNFANPPRHVENFLIKKIDNQLILSYVWQL